MIARNYPFGTSLRMGPGYFPTVLGGILALFGLWFLAKALRSTEKIEPGWSLRALIVIPLALVLFGVLMNHAGFMPALVVLIFGSALARHEFNLVEVVAAHRRPDDRLRRRVHLGPRPALSAVRGTEPPWTFSRT